MSRAAALGWREQWLGRRDRLLASPRFREAASRWPVTRPVARRRARALFDLVAGFVYSQWLDVCVEVDLFERLARAPLTARTLAREVDLPLPSAKRLLEAATALELARHVDTPDDERWYGLGALGAAMVGNQALVAMVRHHRALYADLSDPLALLRRGRGEGELAAYWGYAGGHAPGSDCGDLPSGRTGPYSALMAATQPLVAGQVLDAYSLRRHRRLLDLGGGHGVFVTHALERHPDLEATVFDLPSVADTARSHFAKVGLAARAKAVGGDFHRDDLPRGADIVTLVRVLYDHEDEPALDILRAARRALPAGGRLLVAEPMADAEGAAPMGAAYFGMYLLAMGGGRSRSAEQLAAMVIAAGFTNVRRCKTALPVQAGVLVADAA